MAQPGRRAGDDAVGDGRARVLAVCHLEKGLHRFQFAARPENRTIDATALAELTDREREVVALVAGGLSNDEIATELFISPATARTHVSRAMIKLNARDRAQLVVLAYESGLIKARASD